MSVRETKLSVEGMNCASCVAHVEGAARKVGGVLECAVNLATGRAFVRFESDSTSPQVVAKAITDSGYPAAPEQEGGAHHDHEHDHSDRWFRRAVVGIVLWLPLEVIHWVSGHGGMAMGMTWISLAASTLALIYVGRGFYASAWKALRRGTSNMDTLIALGATVAWGYSAVAFLGHLAGWWGFPKALYFMESSGLLALISLGHWLEARARDSAGNAIRELMTLAPSTALRLDESDTPVEIPVAEVHQGERILLRPGDRVPVDGVILAGRSSVDESMLTGEPLPVSRTIGEEVSSGTLNIDGRLTIQAKRVGSETALAQIVQLVEGAQRAKPPVQQLADRVAAVFVPAVLCIALATGIGWHIWGAAHHWELSRTWAGAANAVCSVLIIACPCALGLALPAALMVGTGMGARRGILIRDIDSLQMAERIGVVVLDKTGTLTQGKPRVLSIEAADGENPAELLRLAASAEQFSAHPLALALVARARADGEALIEPRNFSSESGLGVAADLDGRIIFAGSAQWVRTHGAITDGAASQTSVYVAEGKRLLGTIRFEDPLKPDAMEAMERLHRLGLRTMLLSGDTQAAAEAVAKSVGISEARGGVSPGQKAQAIGELQSAGGKRVWVAMAGDGINDAPALARADLGIAIGGGSDIAKETGGIVLVGGNPRGIVAAILLSRATMRTIRQNLFLAFIYNVLAIPLAALGLLNPLIAAAAMALSDVTVIGNALLLRRSKLD